MPAAAKKLYVGMDLEWAEQQLATWRQYIDDNPIAEMTDRIEWKTTKTGGTMPMVIASIEAQITSVRNTMKEYLSLLKEVNAMRQTEEAKKEAKGSSDVPHRMQRGNN